MGYEWRNGFVWVGPGLEPTIGETKEEYAVRVATEQEPSVTFSTGGVTMATTRGEEIVRAYGGANVLSEAGGPYPGVAESAAAYYARVEEWEAGVGVDVEAKQEETRAAMYQQLRTIGWTTEAIAESYPEYAPANEALNPTIGETAEEYVARVATVVVPSVTLTNVKEEEIIGNEKEPEEKEPTAEELLASEPIEEPVAPKPDNKILLYGAIAIVAVIVIAFVARR